MNDNRFYTYLYTDPSTGEALYVGKGTNKRAYTHANMTRRTPLTIRISEMKANGVLPVISFLCKDVDEETALRCEAEAIVKYGKRVNGTGTLYNIADGGCKGGATGKTFSDEHKAKISASKKGKKRGPLSEEQKAKIGASHRGQKRPPRTPEYIAKLVAAAARRKLRKQQSSFTAGKVVL